MKAELIFLIQFGPVKPSCRPRRSIGGETAAGAAAAIQRDNKRKSESSTLEKCAFENVNDSHFKAINSCLQINTDGLCAAARNVRWFGLVQPNAPPAEAHVRQMTDLKS